ncbi:MAG: hypothetical protein HYX28_10315 [Candidatus Koribacter versatilis]|uniref:Zinc-finger domain-containing protein n=1 Tax=Candidatus Korobacter versatilis TaxID=658062 RepID=A0A932A9Q1_9BACT|nr:hypothetical protein [Candidatus Koribacter versatilis]
MSHDAHTRAKESIVGGTSDAAEQRWLQKHLAACADCAALLDRAHAVRDALHSAPLTAHPAMVAAAQQRLLRHALELSERESRRWMLTASVAVATLFAWISVPLLWQLARWLGEMTPAPAATTIAAFVVVASTPALLAAAAALWLRGSQHAVEPERIRR